MRAFPAKVETGVRCPGSAQRSEDGNGPAHHCGLCGKYFSDEEVQEAGGYLPEHRLLRDAKPGRAHAPR